MKRFFGQSRELNSSTAVGDAIVAAAFLLLGLFLAIYSYVELNAFGAGRNGPGVVPFFCGAVMVLSAGAVIVRLLNHGVDPDIELPDREGALRAFTLLALALATIVAFQFLGGLTAFAVFTLVEMKAIEGRGWVVSLLSAAVAVTIVYIVFVVLLGVLLPHGMFGLI